MRVTRATKKEKMGKRRERKKTQRTAEATLASSFAQLQLKKMELEFAVDPLFKKASADFDEGGAKGLLLNHLAIDPTGKIAFDSSDDMQDATARRESNVVEAPEELGSTAMEGIESSAQEQESERQEIDIAALAAKFFPDLAILDELDVCPSLKNHALGEANGSTDLPFIQPSQDWKEDQRRTNLQDGEDSGAIENDLPAFDDEDGGMD